MLFKHDFKEQICFICNARIDLIKHHIIPRGHPDSTDFEDNLIWLCKGHHTSLHRTWKGDLENMKLCSLFGFLFPHDGFGIGYVYADKYRQTNMKKMDEAALEVIFCINRLKQSIRDYVESVKTSLSEDIDVEKKRFNKEEVAKWAAALKQVEEDGAKAINGLDDAFERFENAFVSVPIVQRLKEAQIKLKKQ